MSKNHWRDSWLSFGLAFVGGYCDAGGYVLAKTFTGHITGTLVLAAISLAGHDWRTLLRHLLAIVVFLIGVVSILISERLISRPPSRSRLPVVMTIEIFLISTAYLALTSHLNVRFELFVGCISLALGSVSENSSLILLNSLEKDCKGVRIILNHGENLPILSSRTRFTFTSEPARMVAG